MRVRRVAGAVTVALLLASCGSGSDDPAEGDAVQSPAVVTEGADADADAADDNMDDADAAGTDPAAYGLDDDIDVLGIGDSAQVEWDSGLSFEVTLHDFIVTETLDLADFDGADFGQGSESYLVDLAEAGEPELETFYVADVTLRNTGPDAALADLVSSFAVTEDADSSPWSIWFAEGPDGTLATMVGTEETYSGRLVGDSYRGDHYILRFETLPDTVWVVPADDAAR